MSMSEMNELKPCPFCGGHAEAMHMDFIDRSDGSEWTVWGVWCVDDLNAEYSHGHFIDNYGSMDDAIEEWNRRAE